MNRNRKLTVLSVAATALVGSGTGICLAASSTGSHTLKFNSVQTSGKQFGTHFVDADKDVSRGKQIGSDVVDGVYDPTTQTFKLSIAAGLKGGLIYATGTGNGKTGKFSGKVTGGTEHYAGITGTITGTSYGKGDDNEHLTISYRE